MEVTYVWYELETGMTVFDMPEYESSFKAIQDWHHNHPLHVSIPPPEGYIAAAISNTLDGTTTYALKEIVPEVKHRNG